MERSLELTVCKPRPNDRRTSLTGLLSTVEALHKILLFLLLIGSWIFFHSRRLSLVFLSHVQLYSKNFKEMKFTNSWFHFKKSISISSTCHRKIIGKVTTACSRCSDSRARVQKLMREKNRGKPGQKRGGNMTSTRMLTEGVIIDQ